MNQTEKNILLAELPWKGDDIIKVADDEAPFKVIQGDAVLHPHSFSWKSICFTIIFSEVIGLGSGSATEVLWPQAIVASFQFKLRLNAVALQSESENVNGIVYFTDLFHRINK